MVAMSILAVAILIGNETGIISSPSIPTVSSMLMLVPTSAAAAPVKDFSGAMLKTSSSTAGWWDFGLNLPRDQADAAKNASLIQVRVIFLCDALLNINRTSIGINSSENNCSDTDSVGMARVLWSYGNNVATKTNIGHLFGIQVDRYKGDAAKTNVRLRLNPIMFSALCDQPQDALTVAAEFQLEEFRFTAKITIPFALIEEAFERALTHQ